MDFWVKEILEARDVLPVAGRIPFTPRLRPASSSTPSRRELLEHTLKDGVVFADSPRTDSRKVRALDYKDIPLSKDKHKDKALDDKESPATYKDIPVSKDKHKDKALEYTDRPLSELVAMASPWIHSRPHSRTVLSATTAAGIPKFSPMTACSSYATQIEAPSLAHPLIHPLRQSVCYSTR